MTGLISLNWLIGDQALSDHIRARVNELVDQGVEYKQACTTVTDAADAGEAWAVAATRQTWIRRHDVDPDEMPLRSLYVLERTDTHVVVAYVDLDKAADDSDAGDRSNLPPDKAAHNDHTQGVVYPFDALDMSFELAAWDPFEHLLPTAAVPASGTTGAEE
ncbi:hypothetical protein OHA84_37845 (plasmid) [Streptomyces sp. NBC_00513]|uniref:hypothetical protein n=1 Tax=unclassified Streptomyces TaxID=2593676 RepID=UPI00225ADC9E|nr:hypothetical protein [Streptomyces sp. NBC_00424]MCX5078783.1 hypothetical protein [Streptomyces sp. NBC_00424]WUD46296.1 hypothetical protein OHA84_37845 [Streptomyces sp. NBC_00513]